MESDPERPYLITSSKYGLLPTSMLDRIMMVPWVCKESSHSSNISLEIFHIKDEIYGKMLSPSCVSQIGTWPSRRLQELYSPLVVNVA